MRVIFAVVSLALAFASDSLSVQAQSKKDKKPDAKVVESVSEFLGKNVEHWIKELKNPDQAKVVFAVEAILHLSADKAELALPVLISLHAQYPLSKFSKAAVLDPSLRMSLTRAIGIILTNNEKSTQLRNGVDRLRASLRDPQYPVRVAALESLEHLGHRAVDAITDIIAVTKERESWELRGAAVATLAAVALDPKAGLKREIFEELYLSAERDSCFQVRLAAIKALLSCLNLDGKRAAGPEDKRVTAEFEKRIDVLCGTDPDPMVKLMANWAVMTVKDEVLVKNTKNIGDLMQHADPNVRIQAISFATKIGVSKKNSAFVPDLIRSLADKDLSVRLAAIEGLGKSGRLSARAVSVIEALLEDKESAVQNKALAALGFMGAVAGPAVESIAKKLSNPDQELLAINALGSIGEPAALAVPVLIEKLKDTNLNTRHAIMRALGNIGDRRAIEPLVKYSTDPNPYIQIMAIEGLGIMGPKAVEAVRPLLPRLKDKEVSVRTYAIQALGSIRAKEAALPIGEQLSDSNGTIVRAALQALAAMGPEASPAVPAINKKLQSKENDIVALAIRALALIGPAGKEASVPALTALINDKNLPEFLRGGAAQAVDFYILEKNKKKTDGQ